MDVDHPEPSYLLKFNTIQGVFPFAHLSYVNF